MAKVSSKQIIMAQIFTVVVSIIGGILLESSKHNIIALAGAVVLYPGIIDLIASVAGALGAKLNHHLETDRYKKSAIIIHGIVFSMAIIIISAVLLGLVAGLMASIFGQVDFIRLVLLSLTTASIVGIIIFPMMGISVVILRHYKINPNNLIGPIESSVVDVVATLIFIIVIGWLV